jgi:hypothetical protein
VRGTRSPGFNANGLQSVNGGVSWVSVLDSGIGCHRPAAGQDHPFRILGTATAACYPNCDESTTPPILNVEDFACFLNRFSYATSLPHNEQLTHYANCDGSTTAPVLNVEDFTCFLNRFAAGCP